MKRRYFAFFFLRELLIVKNHNWCSSLKVVGTVTFTAEFRSLVQKLCVICQARVPVYEYEQVIVYPYLCYSLEPNLINQFYVTSLFLYPLKTSLFWKMIFHKDKTLSILLQNTHIHIHTPTFKWVQSRESQLQRRIQFCDNS